MKRKILLVVILSFIFILAACGMTTEEIDTAITQLDTAYQSGTYDEAKTEIEKLDKSYNKMSDEQKNKFGELRSSVEYAVASVQGINDSLNSVQNYYGQKLYYEAQQELDKISQIYKLPPNEQKKFDEKQTAVSQAITSWEITETIQKAEEFFNSGNYNSASDILSKIDTSNLTNEQNQKITSLKEKIASAKAEVESKGVNSVQTAIDFVLQYRKSNGEANMDNYLGNVYSGEEYSDYYLVKVRVTRNANGESRYKVYKSTGIVEYIGSGSDWIGK